MMWHLAGEKLPFLKSFPIKPLGNASKSYEKFENELNEVKKKKKTEINKR